MPKRKATPTQKVRFLQAIARGARVTAAARYAGVDRTTPYHWVKSDPEFARSWDDARESLLPQIKDMAFELALEGNVQLIKFLIGLYDRPAPAAGKTSRPVSSTSAAGRSSLPDPSWAGEPPVLGEIRIIMPGGDRDEQSGGQFISFE